MSKKEKSELHKIEANRRQLAIKKWAGIHSGRAPMRRRDFISAGVIPFAASLTLPTISSLLWANESFGQTACPSAANLGSAKLAPFITLNLSGGAMLAANYVPMDIGGQLLPSYNKLGLGNSSLPITREFNNAPFAGGGISKFMDAIKAVAAPATLANTAFVAIPCRSQDDSDGNRFDISGMVAKAGVVGEDLPNLGRQDSVTGIRQEFAKVKPPNPLRVRSYNDIAGALGGGNSGALASLSQEQKISFYNLLKGLNDLQITKVLGDSGGTMLANLVQCASDQNAKLAAKAAPPLDVRQDAALSGIWQVNANTGAGDESVVFGSMVLSGLRGSAGTIALDKGGYDYHDNSRSTGDQMDGQAGTIVGKILQSAAAIGEKVFLYVTSDGACSAPVSDDRAAPWTSDRGSAGLAMVFAFDPAGRPATSGFQIGGFTVAQAADDKFITGGSPETAASAAFANYLQFNKRIELLESIIPGTFTVAQLEQILKFA